MTEFRFGDKIRMSAGSGDIYEVLAVHGNTLWVVNAEGGGEPFTTYSRLFEKTFFEVGKKYTCCGDTFEVTAVEETQGGNPVAFGKLTEPSGCYTWMIKPQDAFHVWNEKK